MGPSSTCEQCGKKLKVFSKRTKCMHCMAAVCKACYAPHVVTRHPSAVRTIGETSASSSSTSRLRELLAREQQQQLRNRSNNTATTTRATIATAYELQHSASSDDDVHFLSPVHSTGHADDDLAYDDDDDDDPLLDGIDGVEVVSGEDDDDMIDDMDDDDLDDDIDDDVDLDDALRDDDDDDDDEDDDRVDAYLRSGATAARRMSVEEEHFQYTELLQMQDAVATWAKKEADATRQQRIAKRDSCYSMTPIPNVRSTREYQERELFVVTYTIAVTLVVWGVYALGYVAYIHVRSAM